ncbi:Uncharacterized protein TCM_041096 [Theobroma cacao]|uniref:Uncharacterized protein n=1 Tax=Theobroma cacao TaxID=3641 RepID=A0A061GVB8_THECC|nr:Uncharacterized protein TCM_041096 [Theobroma cacao]
MAKSTSFLWTNGASSQFSNVSLSWQYEIEKSSVFISRGVKGLDRKRMKGDACLGIYTVRRRSSFHYFYIFQYIFSLSFIHKNGCKIYA